MSNRNGKSTIHVCVTPHTEVYYRHGSDAEFLALQPSVKRAFM